MTCYDPLVPSEENREFFTALGARLRELRQEHDLTQVQVAERLGISQQVYASYEGGRLRLPISLLPDICDLFAVPVDSLLGRQGRNGKPGPTPKLQRQIEQLTRLPRSKQKFVSEFLDTVLQQTGS